MDTVLSPDRKQNLVTTLHELAAITPKTLDIHAVTSANEHEMLNYVHTRKKLWKLRKPISSTSEVDSW